MRLAGVLFLLLLVVSCGDAGADRPWTIVYYLSYDNDLSVHGPTIIDRLAEGVEGGDLAVAVLADYAETDRLTRTVLTAGGRRTETLDTDQSASEAVLEGFLGWVAKNLPARRYAVIFPDHGGGLDEMCLDERPGAPGAKHWLSAPEVGRVLARFRQRVAGEVELCFIQQCGRATVENLHSFRDSARYVMASATRVGVPNTYYRAALRRLAKNPDVSGAELAAEIMWEDDQFEDYVCVDAARLADLPAHLDRAVARLAGQPSPLKGPAVAPLCYRVPAYADETVYDLLGWFGAAYAANGLDPAGDPDLAALRRFVTEELVVRHRRHPRHARRIASWCGLGLFVPEAPSVRRRYTDHPFYASTRLDDLWAAMFPAE